MRRLTDINGNVYNTVKIGKQVWTVENLRTTTYNDGTPIPCVTKATEWGNLDTPGYCFYENENTETIKKYGALYNWYAVITGKLAPVGWHVPTDSEWTILENYLIANGYNYDGTITENEIAKAMAAQTDWTTYATVGTPGNVPDKNNKSGFSALPGGCRYLDGTFNSIGSYGTWWSATANDASYAYTRTLYYDNSNLGRSHDDKVYGFSARLLRD